MCTSLWWPHLLEVCVCTLTDLKAGTFSHVHKLTVFYCTGLLPPSSTHRTLHPSSGSVIAGEGRSWSCSSGPLLPSMLPLRVSGAELQHRPPLSNILRTLIHTPEREGRYLEQHTHTHTHKLSKAYECV